MGEALRGGARHRRSGRRALAAAALAALAALLPARLPAQSEAPERLDRGRFTVVFFPSERLLAQSLLDVAMRNDTFPGLPRPRDRVLIALAPDARRFREWIGPAVPEWGAAVAFPAQRRIVMQGQRAGSDAGNPLEVIRHELAHLALHEHMAGRAPRWFDEGYASYSAREWRREDALATNLGLLLRGMPSLVELEDQFAGGSTAARTAYALAYRAVAELAALDPERGLAPLFDAWRETGSLDRALRNTYGMTLAGFEERWQQRTRRRFGVLALFGDLTLIGLAVTFLLAPLYVVRRRRDRARLAAMRAADEAAERAERDAAIRELLGESGPEHRGGG